MKIMIFIIFAIFATSANARINYYQSGLPADKEMYQYVDECEKNHNLIIKREEYENKLKDIERWLDKVLKETRRKGC
jgi:hypothetical protein